MSGCEGAKWTTAAKICNITCQLLRDCMLIPVLTLFTATFMILMVVIITQSLVVMPWTVIHLTSVTIPAGPAASPLLWLSALPTWSSQCLSTRWSVWCFCSVRQAVLSLCCSLGTGSQPKKPSERPLMPCLWLSWRLWWNWAVASNFAPHQPGGEISNAEAHAKIWFSL